MTIVGFCLFCLLTLGAPDTNLLSTNAKIDIPFADTSVTYSAFITVGPLLLLGLSVYLQIFLGRWAELDIPDGRPRCRLCST